MENEHRPWALTENDEVTLPMATIGSADDSCGPFMDGDPILYGIWRRSRAPWPAALATTRERTPRLARPFGCPIDEGGDRRATHDPQTTFVDTLHPAGKAIAHPPIREAINNEGSSGASASIRAARRPRNW